MPASPPEPAPGTPTRTPTRTPIPGRPVRGSKTGKPIMALFDLMGRSWALGVIWRLSEGPARFRALQEGCGAVSPTVLNTRLKELTESGLVAHGPEGYALTEMGADLFRILKPLGPWSRLWAETLGRPEAEPPQTP